MSTVLHLVPHFAPQIDGVGDYARLLARQWRSDRGPESRFLVGDPAWRGDGSGEFPVARVEARHAAALAAALEGETRVLLHYVGYGFDPRGVPGWLPAGLERWRAGGADRRLAVVFHELWSAGPPWRSEFFLQPLQRRLVARLHRLGTVAVASSFTAMGRLDRIERGKTRFQPVPSNLPAVALDGRSWHEGGPVTVAVFGLEATRCRSVRTHERLLRALDAAGLLREVRVIGRGAGAAAAEVRGLRSWLPADRVVTTGDASAEEASRRLAGADLFLSCYPSRWACKSGALMAALACGCAPLLREAAAAEPLAADRELLVCDGSDRSVARFVERVRTMPLGPVGQAGWRWQGLHAAWPATAERLAAWLCAS